MKIIETKNNKYILVIITLIVLIVLCMGLLIIVQDKEFEYKNINIREYKNNYRIEINYPKFDGNSKTNKEIEKNIKEEKDNFKEISKLTKDTENELNINYSYTVKDNIYSFHIRTYSITGENNDYYRNDNIYYFNKITNQRLEIDDLIKDDKIFEIIRDKVLTYLKSNMEEIYNINKENTKLEAKKENYKLIIFCKDYMQVILEPYRLANYENELIININYSDVNDFLNHDFLVVSEFNSDEMVQTTLPKIRDKEQFKDKKLIALTFDDGPSYAKTQKLIDELDKRNARVSFFMLGEHAIKQNDLVKEIYLRGHTIGSHTYDHKQLTKLDDEQLTYEINYTNEILENIIGEKVKYLRPPYGSYNKDILNKVDMSFILWNVDVEDWKLKDSKKISQYIIEHAKDGDIILLHDIHSETIEGVLMAIDELQNDNFAFVSINELLNYKDIQLETNVAYRYFK